MHDCGIISASGTLRSERSVSVKRRAKRAAVGVTKTICEVYVHVAALRLQLHNEERLLSGFWVGEPFVGLPVSQCREEEQEEEEGEEEEEEVEDPEDHSPGEWGQNGVFQTDEEKSVRQRRKLASDSNTSEVSDC